MHPHIRLPCYKYTVRPTGIRTREISTKYLLLSFREERTSSTRAVYRRRRPFSQCALMWPLLKYLHYAVCVAIGYLLSVGNWCEERREVVFYPTAEVAYTVLQCCCRTQLRAGINGRPKKTKLGLHNEHNFVFGGKRKTNCCI